MTTATTDHQRHPKSAKKLQTAGSHKENQPEKSTNASQKVSAQNSSEGRWYIRIPIKDGLPKHVVSMLKKRAELGLQTYGTYHSLKFTTWDPDTRKKLQYDAWFEASNQPLPENALWGETVS